MIGGGDGIRVAPVGVWRCEVSGISFLFLCVCLLIAPHPSQFGQSALKRSIRKQDKLFLLLTQVDGLVMDIFQFHKPFPCSYNIFFSSVVS